MPVRRYGTQLEARAAESSLIRMFSANKPRLNVAGQNGMNEEAVLEVIDSKRRKHRRRRPRHRKNTVGEKVLRSVSDADLIRRKPVLQYYA